QVSGQHDLGVAEVLERAADGVVRRGKNDERRAVDADRVHQLLRLLRLGFVEDKALDDADPFLDGLLAQRAAQGEAPHLLRHALRVVARLGAEDRAAAFHAGLSRAAVAGAAGALLPIGLGAAAAYRRPRL